MTRLMFRKISLSLLLLGAAPIMHSGQALAQDSEATQALKAQTIELRKDIVQVGEGVYTAVGYSPANISMIVGDMRQRLCRRIVDQAKCGEPP